MCVMLLYERLQSAGELLQAVVPAAAKVLAPDPVEGTGLAVVTVGKTLLP